jgi:hypothetical protein
MFHPGLFKDVKFSITNKLDVRSAGFHPVEPVLACGLVSGELVFIRGTDHSTPFENWEMEPKKYRYGRIILSVQWNVSLRLKSFCPFNVTIFWLNLMFIFF